VAGRFAAGSRLPETRAMSWCERRIAHVRRRPTRQHSDPSPEENKPSVCLQIALSVARQARSVSDTPRQALGGSNGSAGHVYKSSARLGRASSETDRKRSKFRLDEQHRSAVPERELPLTRLVGQRVRTGLSTSLSLRFNGNATGVTSYQHADYQAPHNTSPDLRAIPYARAGAASPCGDGAYRLGLSAIRFLLGDTQMIGRTSLQVNTAAHVIGTRLCNPNRICSCAGVT
jgi:hypothetical protein